MWPVGGADHAANATIRGHSRAAFPHDAILTEESGERRGVLHLLPVLDSLYTATAGGAWRDGRPLIAENRSAIGR